MFFWDEEKQRREFSIVTKRIEWLGAADTESAKRVLQKYVDDGKAPSRMPRSKCRVCGKPLTWGDGTYNFDHYDNNSSNNGQRNCYLVCRNCHGGATKIRLVRELDPWFGTVIGYITQKLKVGYKKNPRKPATKTTKKTAAKTTRKTATKPTRKAATKTTKKPTGKTAKKTVTKTPSKSATKTAKKSAIKTASKRITKTTSKLASKSARKRR
jgi:hypothetical protein